MKVPPKEFRRCCDCSQFCFSFEGDYSDLTPGAGLELRCFMRHFELQGDEAQDLTNEQYRSLMRTAIECSDFQIEKDR